MIVALGGSLSFAMKAKSDLDKAQYKVDDLEKRINRFESRQIHLNDKQDAELQHYWNNLELRLGELQKMQFESCKSQK
jgi:hypothetical protein